MNAKEKQGLTQKEFNAVEAQYNYQMYVTNLNTIFKRLEYLFKVLEMKDLFSEEFVSKVKAEIEELLVKNETN